MKERVMKLIGKESPYDVICQGNPTSETYKKAVHEYQNSSDQGKSEFRRRIYRKLKKNKNFSKSLAMVHFIGEIIERDEQKLDLPKSLPEVDYTAYKNDEEVRLLRRYFNFYYFYIRRYIFRPKLEKDIHDTEIALVVKYFEDTEQNIIQIIHEKKMIEECIKRGTNEQIIAITMTWVLKNANQDLIRLHKFFRRHWKLVANNRLFSERLIQCFVNLQKIEHELFKLEKLSALINLQFENNPYALDAKLHETIQSDIKNARILKDSEKNQQWKSCTSIVSRQNCDSCFDSYF